MNIDSVTLLTPQSLVLNLSSAGTANLSMDGHSHNCHTICRWLDSEDTELVGGLGPDWLQTCQVKIHAAEDKKTILLLHSYSNHFREAIQGLGQVQLSARENSPAAATGWNLWTSLAEKFKRGSVNIAFRQDPVVLCVPPHCQHLRLSRSQYAPPEMAWIATWRLQYHTVHERRHAAATFQVVEGTGSYWKVESPGIQILASLSWVPSDPLTHWIREDLWRGNWIPQDGWNGKLVQTLDWALESQDLLVEMTHPDRVQCSSIPAYQTCT